MRGLSLFAGIGGFDLAMGWAGVEVVGQCEIDPFCLKVLERHWPQVWRWNDVRTLTGDIIREHCGRIDIICGGFPCQDVSVAGKQAGLEGERSGLWFDLLRVIQEARPDWCLIENVPGLLNSGLDIVLGGLEEAGYETWTHLLGADDIGAAHRRKRVWIVARHAGVRQADTGHERRRHVGPVGAGHNAPGERGSDNGTAGRPGERGEVLDFPAQCQDRQRKTGSMAEAQGRGQGEHAAIGDAGTAGELAHAHGNEPGQQEGLIPLERRRASNSGQSGTGSALADPVTAGRRKRQRAVAGEPQHAAPECGSPQLADANGSNGPGRPSGLQMGRSGSAGNAEEKRAGNAEPIFEPGLGGKFDALPSRLDCYRIVARPGEAQHDWEAPRTAKGVKNRSARLKALGNSIVSHNAWLILKAIVAIDA